MQSFEFRVAKKVQGKNIIELSKLENTYWALNISHVCMSERSLLRESYQTSLIYLDEYPYKCMKL